MNIAIIDIGSNTIRLNVYEVHGETYSLLLTKKHTAGLAAYVENQRLNPQGVLRLGEILTRLRRLLLHVHVDETYAFATASLRNVSNGREVARTVSARSGIEVMIVPEEEEARLGNLAIRTRYHIDRGVTVDIGGGSAEIVRFSEDEKESVLLNEGSLSLYMKYIDGVFPTKREVKHIRHAVRKMLPKELPDSRQLLVMGGTARAAGKLLSEICGAQPGGFARREIRAAIRKMEAGDKPLIRALLRVAPERVHTLFPGMILLDEIATAFHAKRIVVYEEGVREGFLMDRLQEARDA